MSFLYACMQVCLPKLEVHLSVHIEHKRARNYIFKKRLELLKPPCNFLRLERIELPRLPYYYKFEGSSCPSPLLLLV
jgi:hypothetical protein